MAQGHTVDYDIITAAETNGAVPVVRKITFADLKDAIRKGIDDFWAMPTHVVFLVLIYPIAGLIVGRAMFAYKMIPLLYPVAAGFAFIGPFLAIGLYELSRRRELGRDTSWRHALDFMYSRSMPSILGLGFLLLAIVILWISIAGSIFVANFGYQEPVSMGAFLADLLTTSPGHRVILVGNAIGLAFAILVLALSVVSFPLLLDRNVGLATALATSVNAVMQNPLVMVVWGLIVIAALVIGAIPFFMGLAIVVPVLGHATWHLYRKVVEPDQSLRPEFHPKPRRRRYAAEFPASLFVPSSDSDEDERQ